MAGAEAGVTVSEVRDRLAGCGAAETGCFGSDPEAYLAMQGRFVDHGDAITTRRIAQAATEAGLAGLSLEAARYTPWDLVPDDAAREAEVAEQVARGRTPTAETGAAYRKIVEGVPVRVVEHLGDQSDSKNTRARIARCAHACGMAGLENCPVMKD